MQRTAPGDRGPASFGPPAADPGLPVLPELAARLAEASGRMDPEPVGGGPGLREAARGYWSGRGLPAGPSRILAAPGAEPLLLALLTAIGGDVLLTRPCAAWYAPQALLPGRPTYHVPVPAECGGVPDPFALIETVRRVRAEGGDPRVLVISVADDPCGTVPPPELTHEACEAALGAGLWIISDETYRDTLHDPVETVLLSPAEMCPERTVVLADLSAVLLPAGWPAGIARFPATAPGDELRAAVLAALAGLRAVLPGPVAEAAAHALGEPAAVTERITAAARLRGPLATALHSTVTAHGALARPPRASDLLYADLDPLRPALARRGITDSVDLEDHLTRRFGAPAPGGHRFGDAPDALRVRLSATALAGPDGESRLRALNAPDPLPLPQVAQALERYGAGFAELKDE